MIQISLSGLQMLFCSFSSDNERFCTRICQGYALMLTTIFFDNLGSFLVMGGTPFYRTSNELEHHFRTSDELEQVHLLMIELEHLNFGLEQTNIGIKKPLLLSNYSSNRLEHHFFEH